MPLTRAYLSQGQTRPTTRGARPLVVAVIVYEVFTDPAAKVTNGISASHAGAGAAGTTSMTLGGSLASGGVATLSPARNAVITVTHGTSVVAMSGTITGTDNGGSAITEAWSVTATGTSKTFTGKKAFRTISSITETVAADASANTIIAGSGDVLGLRAPLAAASAVKEQLDGAIVTNGTLVAASSVSTADAFGTYAPSTAPDAAHDYEVWYLSRYPEQARA